MIDEWTMASARAARFAHLNTGNPNSAKNEELRTLVALTAYRMQQKRQNDPNIEDPIEDTSKLLPNIDEISELLTELYPAAAPDTRMSKAEEVMRVVMMAKQEAVMVVGLVQKDDTEIDLAKAAREFASEAMKIKARGEPNLEALVLEVEPDQEEEQQRLEQASRALYEGSYKMFGKGKSRKHRKIRKSRKSRKHRKMRKSRKPKKHQKSRKPKKHRKSKKSRKK